MDEAARHAQREFYAQRYRTYYSLKREVERREKQAVEAYRRDHPTDAIPLSLRRLQFPNVDEQRSADSIDMWDVPVSDFLKMLNIFLSVGYVNLALYIEDGMVIGSDTIGRDLVQQIRREVDNEVGREEDEGISISILQKPEFLTLIAQDRKPTKSQIIIWLFQWETFIRHHLEKHNIQGNRRHQIHYQAPIAKEDDGTYVMGEKVLVASRKTIEGIGELKERLLEELQKEDEEGHALTQRQIEHLQESRRLHPGKQPPFDSEHLLQLPDILFLIKNT